MSNIEIKRNISAEAVLFLIRPANNFTASWPTACGEIHYLPTPLKKEIKTGGKPKSPSEVKYVIERITKI